MFIVKTLHDIAKKLFSIKRDSQVRDLFVYMGPFGTNTFGNEVCNIWQPCLRLGDAK